MMWRRIAPPQPQRSARVDNLSLRGAAAQNDGFIEDVSPVEKLSDGATISR
jgi:hypothetical protein